MIKLNDILSEVIKEGGKLFGIRASRVTTSEMNAIFNTLQKQLGDKFTNFKLSKALPSKEDHGDIDIVLSGNSDIKKLLFTNLGSSIKDYSKNGNIYSILYHDDISNKDVHIDFIAAAPEEYASQYDYLSYNDFSGILGVLARRLKFKYGTDGIFKIYEDKRGQNHYILLSKNLRDGLKMFGYANILNNYDNIQNIDDIVNFISYTDLFDSKYFTSGGLNRGDRRRMRAGRPSADAVKNKFISLNKSRTQPDDDYYLKLLFPDKYKQLVDKIKEIETIIPANNSKYTGDWIIKTFNVKPGPIIGKIKLFWTQKYGDKLENVPEDELIRVTNDYLKSL